MQEIIFQYLLLQIFMRIKKLQLPLNTWVFCKYPLSYAGKTDLLIAAAKTGKIVNVKKGQFVNGESMKFAVEKIAGAGNQKVMLTERGNTFGYNGLVVDYRNIPLMNSHKVPVVMDCTHSLQQPGIRCYRGKSRNDWYHF